MSTLTIFVPEYVNVDTIDKCFQDKKSSFEHVDSATFDAAAQQVLHKRFLFLEKEHFLVYFNEGEPFKCHYQSRGVIMIVLYRSHNCEYFNFRFPDVNGLRMTEQKPIHYFVCSEDSHARCHYKATEVNSILEYFDSKDDVDLAKLADIVKSKPYCVQKYFIINKGTEYRAVETNNVENTFIFNFEHRSSIVRALVAGTATIDTLIEKYKRLEYKFANPERQAGFKLRDSNGKIIPDGKEFAIQILRDPGEGSDEEETKGFSSGEFPFHNKDWIDINDSMEDGNDYFLFGHPDGGDIFECETIDDIVYLKHNGGYLYFDVDDQLDDIFIGKAVPTKEQRIQIHYTDDGYICLTAWGGRVCVTCDWIKGSYGSVQVEDTVESFEWVSPMKLHLAMI
ncbi:hypothetical protein J3F81_000317 [Coemansia sp. RSA 371]|nr:hypothetical protein J3F81_000317 [Coemansia sp. RSA 371]